MNENVSPRWDAQTKPEQLPNTEALKKYAQEVSNVVIKHPSAKKITENQVANIMKRRADLLIRISKKNESSTLIVDDHNREVLRALKLYAMRDPRFESEGFGELNKGLMISGLQGCGKTIMLKMLADAGPIDWKHDGSLIQNLGDLKTKSWGDGVRFELFHITNFFNCIKIEHDFRAKDGEQRISAIRSSRAVLVFDDLGFENDKVLNYGNRVNIMAEIINARYNWFQDYGIVTHFTTNLVNGDEVEKLYSSRIRSRLREMCNTIRFDVENHIDRRK